MNNIWFFYWCVISAVAISLLYPSVHTSISALVKTWILKRKILKHSTYKELYRSNYSDENFNLTRSYPQAITRFESGLREFLNSNGVEKVNILTSCYDLIVLHNLPLRDIVESRGLLNKKLTLEDLKDFLNDMTTPNEVDIIGTLLFVESYKL